MLSTPVTSRKSDPATRGIRLSRATSPESGRSFGGSTSWWATLQSLASSNGTETMPVNTCSPWVRRNSQTGRVGQANHAGRCWSRCDASPVRKQTEKDTPSATPSQEAVRES